MNTGKGCVNTLTFDLEANNLIPMVDTIWCVATKWNDEETLVWKDRKELANYIWQLPDSFLLIGHNILKYDLNVLTRLWKFPYTIGKQDTFCTKPVTVFDTCAMSEFLNPDRQGGHSLENWGNIVGVNKMDFRGELVDLGVIEWNAPKGEEFKQYHPLMDSYCIQDVETTYAAYKRQLREIDGY